MKGITLLRLFSIFQVLVLVRSKQRPEAVIRHPVQMMVDSDADPCTEFKVTLDGSLSTNAGSYEWRFVEGPGTVLIPNPSLAVTNVTIPRSHLGVFKLELRVSTPGGQHSHTYSEVLVQDPDDVGMYHLAKDVVDKLLRMQYKYLMISKQFMRADNFYPNVAEYFRKMSSDRASMLQTVIDYITAKQATVDLTSSHPADHVTTMMIGGFPDVITLDSTPHRMTSSFQAALGLESKLANDLALVSQRAENNHDYDLSQFAAADLLPQVTKVMHEQTSHLKTVLEPAQHDSQRRLVEYLFDRHLKL